MTAHRSRRALPRAVPNLAAPMALEVRIASQPMTCLDDLAAKVSAPAVDETKDGASVVAEARALVDTLGRGPVGQRPTDPLPGLVDAFFIAQAACGEAGTYEPDEGHCENAICQAMQAEMDRLRPLIEGTTATTAEGIIAQLAYIEEDFGGGFNLKDGATVSNVPVSLLRRLAVAAERLQWPRDRPSAMSR